MTEIEQNERLVEIEAQRLALLPPTPPRRTGRRYRRERNVHANDRLLKIIRRYYIPHAGYIDYGFEGTTLLHSGKYIKFPQNSNCQRWIKRTTSRKIRSCKDVPQKGNFYRRLFDYWWTLY